MLVVYKQTSVFIDLLFLLKIDRENYVESIFKQ